MQKKPLKVQPARRIYQPKYPSFEDKSPLLYPETRPYPFSLKFIKWASTGGLASIMLFSGCEASGQAQTQHENESQTDSLYNPFPLENARVPYQPVSFGTGMPERLKSEEVRQAIRKAFTDSGIELDEKVWLKNEEVGVFLDGYSHKDEMGFLLMDYTNMDGSFAKDAFESKDQKEYKKNKYSFKHQVKWYREQQERQFLDFIDNKKKVVSRLKRYAEKEAKKKYAKNLSKLEPLKESEALYNQYYLQYQLDGYRENYKDKEGLVKEIFQYIDNRFNDSIEKKVLFNFVNSFKKTSYSSDEYSLKVGDEFRQLKKIKSNEKFIENYFKLIEFLAYNSDSYKLTRDSAYNELKLNIMKSYPLKKWMDNVESLHAYHDRKFLSLDEARFIDKNNKTGTQFIAPISLRDRMMIVPNGYSSGSKELQEETVLLRKEYNQKNGMTDEILAQRREEHNEMNKKYSWTKLKKLPKQEKDSLRAVQKEEREIIKAKYKAMEQLTDEERAEFKVKFDDLEKRKREWRKANKEEVRMEVLRKLEEEVKIYIKWAKSQMGG